MTVFVFVIFFVMLVVLHYIGAIGWVERTGLRIINPLIHVVYKQNVKIRTLTETFSSTQELVARLEELQSRVNQLEHLEATSAVLLVENEELKKQLNFFRQHENYRWVTCNVVGETIEERTSGVILDCGTRDAIAVGQAVVAGEGVLVGKVVEANEVSSVVRLLNDSKSRVAVSVLNKDRSIGIAEGGFGISVQVTHIPQSEELSEGNTVITSGLEEYMPRGLVVGSLETITRESYQPFQRGVIRVPLDYQKLIIVSVVTVDAL